MNFFASFQSVLGLRCCRFMLIIYIAVWRIIPDRRWPSWLISSSFAVFATHQLIIKLTEFGLKQVGFDIIAYAGNSGVWWIIMTFVYTTVGVAFALFLRNFFPRLAIVLFGGR